MKQIHNDRLRGERMPLFLPFNLAMRWLTDPSDDAIPEVIAFEMPPENLVHYPVSTIRGKNALAMEERSKQYNWDKLPIIN